MTTSTLPDPTAGATYKEHPAAATDRARVLLDNIPDDADTLNRMRGRHVLASSDFDAVR